MDKSKQPFSKSKRSFHRRERASAKAVATFLLGDRISYRNMSLIGRRTRKRLSRRVNRLTLKQQRLITIAIKKARILSLLPFLNNEKQFERTESIPRITGTRTIKK
ncbi:hypothetical protein AMTRI_Chr06g171360 [Amborella trichopoda]